MENIMVPRSHQGRSRDVVRSFDLPKGPSQPQTDHKLPNMFFASVPFLSYSSAMVMKQGQAAEAAKTTGHILHIILGSGHCGGVGAQRSEIIVIIVTVLILSQSGARLPRHSAHYPV